MCQLHILCYIYISISCCHIFVINRLFLSSWIETNMSVFKSFEAQRCSHFCTLRNIIKLSHIKSVSGWQTYSIWLKLLCLPDGIFIQFWSMHHHATKFYLEVCYFSYFQQSDAAFNAVAFLGRVIFCLFLVTHDVSNNLESSSISTRRVLLLQWHCILNLK